MKNKPLEFWSAHRLHKPRDTRLVTMQDYNNPVLVAEKVQSVAGR